LKQHHFRAREAAAVLRLANCLPDAGRAHSHSSRCVAGSTASTRCAFFFHEFRRQSNWGQAF
jgi:hypothetical protein